MKNFPHQFNDLDKSYEALRIAKQLIDDEIPLNDNNYGRQLTIEGVYTYRETALSVEEYFQSQQDNSSSYRGYETASRETRRFFQYLGFLIIDEDKNGTLSPLANQLLETETDEKRREIWKTALLQLTLEADGEISHPYRILLRLVNTFPGIETSKLLLALEAENDSDEEFERIAGFIDLPLEEIVENVGTTRRTADNAVKILPGIAVQLGDIERIRKRAGSRAYPVNQIVTEDGIITEGQTETARRTAPIRQVTAEEIAPTPNFQDIPSIPIDPTEANRMRQKRFTEHQQIVRLLGRINVDHGFEIFEDRFDCVATKSDTVLLYEVKTILESFTDQEKQTLTAVGQLKYYEFSEVQPKWHDANIEQIVVFSQKPHSQIVEFCTAENIIVVWQNEDNFQMFNPQTGADELFNPANLL